MKMSLNLTANAKDAPNVTVVKRKQNESNGENSAEPSRKIARKGEKDERDEQRMEINRLRAKQIRKRKKEMEEDMQKQIIQLTLENNKLRTQLKVQETEIVLLRNQQMNYPILTQQLPQSYSQNLYSQNLTGSNSPLDMLSPPGLNNQHMFQNNPALAQLAIGTTMSNTQQKNQTLLPSIPSSSFAGQAGMLSNAPNHEFNFLGGHGVSQGGHIHSSISNTNFDIQDNADQKSLERLLTGSSAHVKQSLLEKLQNEGNIQRDKIQ